MQPTILEFTMYDPPQTGEPLDPEKPLFAGWLKKYGMQILYT